MTRRVLLSLAMMLAVFVSPAAAQPKEVVIGVVYPLSGPAALTGLENKVVNEIARDIANGEVDIPLPFYQRLLRHEAYQRGDLSTHFIRRYMSRVRGE